jgi:hypothetical protein
VTRFGEFSPLGRLFSLGGIFKITKVAQIFGTKKHGTNFDTKRVGYTFGYFAKTHLVTLLLLCSF